MTKSISTGRFVGLLGLCAMLSAAQGCTDLTESPKSSIIPDNFFQTEEEVMGGLVGVYAQLRSILTGYGDYYNVIESSSDEMIVPTRGSDWFDNGIWQQMHRHTWEPNSPSALSLINSAWVAPNTGIARANVVLEALDREELPDVFEAGVRAEARALRAFYYYLLMDLFGGVPIVTDTKIEPRERATRAEVFAFIEQELTAALPDLRDTWPPAAHGRMTKGAADAILASLYLNAAVFQKDDGISIDNYNSCATATVAAGNACDAAIAAADRILNSPAYSLATDWRANFRPSNDLSPENILVVKFVNQSDLGFRLFYATLHYNQISPSPWNGFSTLADVYNAFDVDDARRGSFLVGQQYNLDSLVRGDTVPVTDRQGNPLVFTVSIGNLEAASEGEGARIGKWTADPNRVGFESNHDFAFFRLAEIMLIKAEALNEKTPGDAGALALVNQVRARAFEPDEPLTAIDRDAILRERLFELVFEGKRRQDLIRHGRFDDAWGFKNPSSAHRVLMPIPQPQIDANPLLVQNPGYN